MTYPYRFIISLLLLLPTVTPAAAEESLFTHFSKNYNSVLVERVISTDTFVLESGERIRMIGLHAPEVPSNTEKIEYDSYGFVVEKPANPLTTVEEKAIKFIKDLLEGKTVRLEFDQQKKASGRSSATLAYVYLEDDTFVNEEVLKAGYANLRLAAPNLKHEEILTAAYREARREKRGLQSE